MVAILNIREKKKKLPNVIILLMKTMSHEQQQNNENLNLDSILCNFYFIIVSPLDCKENQTSQCKELIHWKRP